MSILKKLVIGLGILGLLALFLWPRLKHVWGDESGQDRAQVVKAEAKVLSEEEAANTYSTTGNVLPDERVSIQTEVSGRVEEISFEEGSKVQEGDLLLRINNDDLIANRKSLEARIERLENREERQSNLLEADGISREAYEETYYELQSLRAELENIEAQINKTTIHAPFDGRIGIRDVSPGSYVSPEHQIATLVKETPLKIEFSVPERYAPMIQVDDSIRFSVAGMNEKRSARVFAREPLINERTRSLRINAVYPNAGGTIIPGSFASIELETVRFDEAINVPTIALIPDIDEHHVFTYENGEAHKTSVEIGARSEDHIHVKEGLSAGDTLLVTGVLNLSDGAPTEITNL